VAGKRLRAATWRRTADVLGDAIAERVEDLREDGGARDVAAARLDAARSLAHATDVEAETPYDIHLREVPGDERRDGDELVHGNHPLPSAAEAIRRCGDRPDGGKADRGGRSVDARSTEA